MSTHSPSLASIAWTLFRITLGLSTFCSVAHADDSAKQEASPASERSGAPPMPGSEALSGDEAMPGEASAAVEEPVRSTPDVTVALRLLKARDPQGALSSAILAESGPHPHQAGYLRAMALIELDRTPEAIPVLEGVAVGTTDPVLQQHARMLAYTALFADSPELAQHQSAALLEVTPSTDHARLHALTQVHQGRFPAAAAIVEAHAPELLPELSTSVSAGPRWRSPGAAAGLAVVPGVGHLYAGAPRQAASAFVVNSVFATGIALAARNQAWGTVGVLGFFGAGFYMGNMYGAADAARRHNRKALRTIERDLAAQGWQVPHVWLPDESEPE